MERQLVELEAVGVGGPRGERPPVGDAASHARAALPVGADSPPFSGVDVGKRSGIRAAGTAQQLGEQGTKTRVVARPGDHQVGQRGPQGFTAVAVDGPPHSGSGDRQLIVDLQQRAQQRRRDPSDHEQDGGGAGAVDHAHAGQQGHLVGDRPTTGADHHEQGDVDLRSPATQPSGQAHSSAPSRQA